MRKVKTITINFEEYEEMIRHEHKLEALEAAGVNYWTGYTDAIETLNNEEVED